MVQVSSSKLLAELLENNDFFDMIVDMIPTNVYSAGQQPQPSGEEKGSKKNPYHKGVKVGSKEAKKAAAKTSAKRRKVDASNDEKSDDHVVKEGEHEQKNGVKSSQAAAQPSDTKSAPLAPTQSRIEALRSKLQAKIDSTQGQRPKNPDQISKRAARRAEKRKRQEEAAKRKKAGPSKLDTLKSAAAHYKVSDAVDPAQDLANLDFGRLAGLNKTSSDNYLENNKALANLTKKKNLKKIIADAEAKRQKLEQLKKGSEEEKAQAASIQWSETLKEADGQRIKDDPSKLKKVLKRKAVKKAKSQKAWKTRMDQQAEKKDERQQIRQHNLNARKKGGATGANLSRKALPNAAATTEGKDNGKRRAGFEGRKREFLNSPKAKTAQ